MKVQQNLELHLKGIFEKAIGKKKKKRKIIVKTKDIIKKLKKKNPKLNNSEIRKNN